MSECSGESCNHSSHQIEAKKITLKVGGKKIYEAENTTVDMVTECDVEGCFCKKMNDLSSYPRNLRRAAKNRARKNGTTIAHELSKLI